MRGQLLLHLVLLERRLEAVVLLEVQDRLLLRFIKPPVEDSDLKLPGRVPQVNVGSLLVGSVVLEGERHHLAGWGKHFPAVVVNHQWGL